MKNFFKSKKGVAVEMSVIFLLTVFLLCGIIAILSFMVSLQGSEFTKEQNQKFALDRLGDAFISAVNSGAITNDTAKEFVAKKMKDFDLTDGYDFYVAVSSDGNASLVVFTTKTTDKIETSGEVLDEEVVIKTGEVLNLVLKQNQVVKWVYN